MSCKCMQVAKTNDLQKCASCREDSISGGDAASLGRNDFMLDVLLDTVLDSVRLLPFLFLTYLFMEALEHHTGSRLSRKIQSAGNGDLCGAVCSV